LFLLIHGMFGNEPMQAWLQKPLQFIVLPNCLHGSPTPYSAKFSDPAFAISDCKQLKTTEGPYG
jgi:hypothetical protein